MLDPALLQPFCSTDPTREALSTPFNVDPYTYATTGTIIVRTGLIPGQPASSISSKFIDQVFTDNQPTEPFILPTVGPLEPTPEPKKCTACRGTGECDCDCPKCDGDCQQCNGTGNADGRTPTEPHGLIKDHVFRLRLIEKAQTLPNLTWAFTTDPSIIAFKNEHCEGRLAGIHKHNLSTDQPEPQVLVS